MEVSNRAKWIVGLVLALVLALSTYLGVNNPQPVVVDTPVFEQTRGGAVQVNKLVVQDTFTVGGATTQTGAFAADGGLTVGGGYGSTGCTLSTAGVLQCDGAATFGGTVTASGGVADTKPVLAKIADYTVLAGDTGSVIKASGAITLTLPGAAVGLNYCIINFTGDDQVIDFTDATDVALNEVNSPGDRVTNTTAYDNICLTAIDTTNWVTISSLGTWSDGN